MITRHGDPIAVVVDIEDFRATHGGERKPSFREFLLSAPKVDDFEIPERTVEPDRTERLFEERTGSSSTPTSSPSWSRPDRMSRSWSG